MGARTTAREAALQMLYALEASGASVEAVLRDYWAEMPGDAEGRAYADSLVRGVAASLTGIDDLVRVASRNWRLERMTRVDRNLLRLGAYEIVSCREVPRAVVLDEAVELAKRFGTAESGAFVNGVLDRIADECGRVDDDRGHAAAPAPDGPLANDPPPGGSPPDGSALGGSALGGSALGGSALGGSAPGGWPPNEK